FPWPGCYRQSWVLMGYFGLMLSPICYLGLRHLCGCAGNSNYCHDDCRQYLGWMLLRRHLYL
ncbi:uncharacterized protein METZ01_LOCUS485889, partial [marine metagenome]